MGSKVALADTWEDECLARRQKLIEDVVAAETALDKELGDSRPPDFYDLEEKMLKVEVVVWPEDDPVDEEDEPVDEEEWRTSWQLAYWLIDGRWRFVFADETMPPDLFDDLGLMAPAIPLVDAPNVALLYYGRRIEKYADRIRHTIKYRQSDEYRTSKEAVVRNVSVPK